MGALDWISQLFEWVGRFIPRVQIVRSTHAGVKFRHGKNAKRVGPGLTMYWPIVTEIDVVPVVRQTHNLPTQALMTKDGKKVVVSGVVIFAIADILAYMSKNFDAFDTLNDVSMVTIAQVITTHDYSYLLENLTTEVQAELTKQVRKKLRLYGVRVYRASLTDFATCLVIKNLGGGNTTLAAHNQD